MPARGWTFWAALLAGLTVLAGVGQAAAAAPTDATPVAGAVVDAAARPAIAARQPARAVLLAAAQAGQRLVAVGERGLILLSDDQGASWRQAQVPVSVTLTALRFADAQRGYAVGHAGVVLATDDGGAHWRQCLDGLAAAQVVLADAQARLAQAPGDAAAAALKEAQRLVADGADKPWLDLLVQDARRLVVVGAYGLALASDDGGRRWQAWMPRLDNPKALHLYAIRAQGPRWLIVGEQGLLLHSSDGGARFQRLAPPYKGSFFTAELLPGQGLLAAGLRGNAVYSPDGGQAWQAVAPVVPVSYTASALLGGGAAGAGDQVLLANQAGQLLRWHGGQMAVLPAPSLPPVAGLLPLADGGLLALGLAGVVRLPALAGEARP